MPSFVEIGPLVPEKKILEGFYHIWAWWPSWSGDLDYLGRVMRKPDFCSCENKDADQLCSNCTADQRLCFRYSDSTIPTLPLTKIFKILTFFQDCTGWFVSDLVGNPEDRFSRVAAHL